MNFFIYDTSKRFWNFTELIWSRGFDNLLDLHSFDPLPPFKKEETNFNCVFRRRGL